MLADFEAYSSTASSSGILLVKHVEFNKYIVHEYDFGVHSRSL